MKVTLIPVATSLLITSVAVQAAPTISGNTISWPDDGWYQVQAVNEDGIFEICQGGRSCEVTQGEYIVINHTTGERFKDLFVMGAPASNNIVVTGNTISWPNNGWYQVQDEISYTEVCGGTRSCTVVPGSYVVINHSTGERFEGIQVDGDDSLPAPEGLNVLLYSSTAAEVFWNRSSTPGLRYEISLDGMPLGESGTTDGTSWFLDTLEPGSTSTFTIVAIDVQGLRSSALDVVIETSGGQVGTPEPPIVLGSPIIAANLDAILRSVLAVPSSNGHTEVNPDISALSQAVSVEVPGLTLLDSEFIDEDGGIIRSRFECDAGGTFEHRAVPSALPDISMTFNGCNYAGKIFNGQAGTSFDGSQSARTYQSLDVTSLDDGSSVQVNGRFTLDVSRASLFFIETYSDVNYSINEISGDTTVTSMNQRAAFLADEDPTNRFETRFTMNAPWTNNRSVTISTAELFQDLDNGRYPIGQLLVSEADEDNQGNTLVIDTNTGNIDTFLVTLTVEDTVTSEIRNWADYPALPFQ